MSKVITVTAAAKSGSAGVIMSVAKAAAWSPLFGVAALGGIIALECWLGREESKKLTAKKG